MDTNTINTSILVTDNNKDIFTLIPVNNLYQDTTAFKSYKSSMDNLANEVNQSANPFDPLSLFKPFHYNPKPFVDDNKIFNTEEIFKLFIKQSKIKPLDILNWLFNGITQLLLPYVTTGTPEVSTTLNTAYIKYQEQGTDSSDTSDSSDSSDNSNSSGNQTPQGYTYLPIGKYKGKYIYYYEDGKVYVSNNKTYQSLQDPIPNQTLSESDMIDIILQYTKIKFHYLQKCYITYSDNSHISLISHPYFYARYGLQNSINYNLMLNNIRNNNIGTNKTLTSSKIEHYYYGYLHILGVYVFKFIYDNSIQIPPTDLLPYINTDFYKSILSIKDLDLSVPTEIEQEKKYMNG